MTFKDLIGAKCNSALSGGPVAVVLSGLDDNAPARIRTLVSLFGRDHRVRLSVSHDKAENVVWIEKKTEKPMAKATPVEIPSCLFRFLNKGQATGDELRELAAFSQLLREKLEGVADEVIVAENAENLI